MLRQQSVVPHRDLDQPIVGNHEGTSLRRSEVIEAEGRHLGNAEFAAGEPTAVTRNYVAVTIDQDRDIEAEGLDAFGDLPDLLRAVTPSVGWVGF